MTTNELSLALQKVSVAQHPDPSSPLSGIRLHVLGNSLHLTGTDDNRRGAIYHLKVEGTTDFWGAAPASFLPDLVHTFSPKERVRIGTDGKTLVASGGSGNSRTWEMGRESAFTLGCFAGMKAGWRAVEPGKYWLKGAIRPLDLVVLEGRVIQQSYDDSDIFDEAYEEEYDEEEYAATTVAAEAPAAATAPLSAVVATGSSPLVVRPAPVLVRKSDKLITGSLPVAAKNAEALPAERVAVTEETLRERDEEGSPR